MRTVAQALDLAVQQHQAGQLEQAEQIYRAILEVQPQQVDALHLLGVLAHQVGKHEQARTYIAEALRLRPDFVEAYINLGHVLREQGQRKEALACLQQALRLQPNYAEAHNNLGNVLQDQGQLEHALASYQQAVRLEPGYAEAHNNLGNVLLKQGQLVEAFASYQQALHLKPDYAEAHNNLGNVLLKQEQLTEAQACLQRALRLRPDFAEAHYNLGKVLQEQGQLAQAQACYQQALGLEPVYAEAHNNLGVVFQEQDKLEEALASLQQALRLKPDYAEAHWNRALVCLLAGDFEQAWQDYEWRWQRQTSSPLRFPQPLWDGSPLHGQTILLHAEQGLGDTLHFIRYASLVKERGGSVLVACQPPLIPLLRSCRGIDQLLPQGSPLPPFDVYAPLLSLPRIFGTTLTTVPAAVPYLFADPQRCHRWHSVLRSLEGFKIGIGWQGNPRYRGDRQRSLPLVQFAPLAQLPGVQLISLQKGFGSEQVRTLADRFNVLELGSRLDEGTGAFEDTAAVLQHLDLIITSDTALPHLAGALGVPVWVALPFTPDWRWLRQREDSPWYPTMRLFRQREQGNWAEVFERITAAVQQRLAQGKYAS
jgi:tetratricopeptide (TPR) repeat protein